MFLEPRLVVSALQPMSPISVFRLPHLVVHITWTLLVMKILIVAFLLQLSLLWIS
jgi:hypothetical protein